jgi:putative ATPase
MDGKPNRRASADDPLFSSSPGLADSSEPLASRMRPRNLDEFAGQEHIVGPGRLLRRAIQKDQLSSIILSGPPGTGKTTLARVIANTTSSRFVTLNAVLAGVADIRNAIEEAKRHRELYDRRTMLFVDEVHRWNKAQQDALLPWVENGTILLIGATTENPFFEVNRALVSRSRVFQLKALAPSDLMMVASAAIADRERGYGEWKVEFEEGALDHLVDAADGDARSLLNALELAVETSSEPWPPAPGATINVSLAAAEESIQRRAVLYDKDGDYHYDSASAFIKSIRGSDPDAALYWLSRMVYAGEDPRFAFRRMLISACEDIGLADPAAVQVVLACAQAFDRIGMPEGQFHLAHAALYLATAPKSNSALGFFDALASVETEAAEVPSHLKDASRDAAGFGHGEGYLYPHAYRDHWVAQQYLPESLKGRVFYQPGSLGLEGERRLSILEHREAQVAALFEASSREPLGEAPNVSNGESFAWSKAGEGKREWRSRAEGNSPARLSLIRKSLFDRACPSRDDRVLVLDAREGYIVWEALRRSPEGTVAAAASNPTEAELIRQYSATLQEIERPLVAELPLEAISTSALESAFGFSTFELVVGRDILVPRNPETPGSNTDLAPGGIMKRLASCLPEARFAIVQSLPRESGRLSEVFSSRLGPELAALLRDFEDSFFSRTDLPALGPTRDALEKSLKSAGLGISIDVERSSFSRLVSSAEIENWFSTSSAYGAALAERLGRDIASRMEGALSDSRDSLLRRPVDWPLSLLFVKQDRP